MVSTITSSSPPRTNVTEALKQELKPIHWANMSSLGEPDPGNITKQDLLAAIAFDKHGEYLAVGDRGGRVIVF